MKYIQRKNKQAYLPPRRNTSPNKCKIGCLCQEQWAACWIKPSSPEEDLWVKKADHGYKIKVNSLISSKYFIWNDCVFCIEHFLPKHSHCLFERWNSFIGGSHFFKQMNRFVMSSLKILKLGKKDKKNNKLAWIWRMARPLVSSAKCRDQGHENTRETSRGVTQRISKSACEQTPLRNCMRLQIQYGGPICHSWQRHLTSHCS